MSLQPNPANWFEIPVADLERARHFYEAVFEVELTLSEMGPNKMASFPMEMGRAGSAGALIVGPGCEPSIAGTRVYLHVPDIESVLARIEDSGGKTRLPKSSIGHHGFMAHFEDCEGNGVGLHQAPQQRPDACA
ncbi:MAG: VOC family protein [Planctomycetales bacterium]|nr:VOC family protein [Planctomycetales bacterium]